MTTTAETFSRNFRETLTALGRTSPDAGVSSQSNLTNDWQQLPPAGQGDPGEVIQFRCWTERFIGPVQFGKPGIGESVGPNVRIRVIRLLMEFWLRLDDPESEEDVIGLTGQMQSDFDLWGSPEYWRDVYPSDPALDYSIQRLDDEVEPLFTAENIGGVLMHYSISVGLLAVP